MEPNFESKWPNFVWNKRLTNIHEMRGEDVWEQPKYLAFVFVGVRVGWEDRKKVGGRTRRAIMQRWICMNFIWGGWDITTSKQMNKKFRSRSNEAKSYQKNNYIFSRSNKKKDIWKQRESEREREIQFPSSQSICSLKLFEYKCLQWVVHKNYLKYNCLKNDVFSSVMNIIANLHTYVGCY